MCRSLFKKHMGFYCFLFCILSVNSQYHLLFSAGMKREAIQFERDAIGAGGRKQRKSAGTTPQLKQQHNNNEDSEQSQSPGPENYQPMGASDYQRQHQQQSQRGGGGNITTMTESPPEILCADVIGTLMDMEV
jgi:hypothetical protein